MATGYDQLPEAILEETVHPDEVVLIPQEDGTVHMLLYQGKVDNGYLALKYVILDQKHVEGVSRMQDSLAGVIDRATRVETVVPFREPDPAAPRAPLLDLTQLPQPVFVDDDVIRQR